MELDSRDEFESRLTDCLRHSIGKKEEELLDQLGDPPRIENVDPSFWDELRDGLLGRCVEEILLSMFLASAVQHLTRNIVIRITQEQARRRTEEIAKAWSSRRAEELKSILASNSVSIAKRKAEIWRNRIESGASIIKKDAEAFASQAFGDNRIRGIVKTETTNTIASGGEIAMQEAGLASPNDLWINNPELSMSGPCTICLPLHRTTRAVWSNKFPFGPPAHINCVCEIVYWNINRMSGDPFIASPDGTVVAPEDRGTRPEQLQTRF